MSRIRPIATGCLLAALVLVLPRAGAAELAAPDLAAQKEQQKQMMMMMMTMMQQDDKLLRVGFR